MYNLIYKISYAKKELAIEGKNFTLDDLSALTNIDKRTIRYYIQIGLVPRPIGETRSARYEQTHFERILLIKKWRNYGFSLERIAKLLNEDKETPARKKAQSGEMEVRTHITVCDGVEIEIAPERIELTMQQIGELIHEIAAIVKNFTKEKE